MEGFQKWYQRLIKSAISSNGNINDHPLGSCAERDVLRDKRVKALLKEVWEDIFLNKEKK